MKKYLVLVLMMVVMVCNAKPPKPKFGDKYWHKHTKIKKGQYVHKCPKKKNIINAVYW